MSDTATPAADVFEHEGRTFRLRELNDEAVVQGFKNFLVARELDRLAESGLFDWGGPRFDDAVRTPAGVVRLGSLLFGCTEREFRALAEARNDEVVAAFKLRFAGLDARAAVPPSPGRLAAAFEAFCEELAAQINALAAELARHTAK
jgi:hypothetical protein